MSLHKNQIFPIVMPSLIQSDYKEFNNVTVKKITENKEENYTTNDR